MNPKLWHLKKPCQLTVLSPNLHCSEPLWFEQTIGTLRLPLQCVCTVRTRNNLYFKNITRAESCILTRTY